MLAIVIPTYNNLEMLKRLVEQIYERTHEDFRLYVIEDGQRNEAVKYLKYIEKNNLYYILHYKNDGVAKSWNDGIKRAISDGCDRIAIFNDDIEIPDNWYEPCKREFEAGAEFISLPTQMSSSAFSGWFFLLSSKIIDKIGLFDESFGQFYHEDLDYAVRLSKTGIGVSYLDLPVIHHESTTIENGIRKNNLKHFKKVVSEGRKKLMEKHKDVKFDFYDK